MLCSGLGFPAWFPFPYFGNILGWGRYIYIYDDFAGPGFLNSGFLGSRFLGLVFLGLVVRGSGLVVFRSRVSGFGVFRLTGIRLL